jgi:hypothetical protein
VEELARLVLLLLFAALVINLVVGGPDRVKAWLNAKFLGKEDGRYA